MLWPEGEPRHVFKAGVLVDFLENPLRPLPSDRPEHAVKKAQVSAAVDAVEKDTDVRLCNAMVWWARGSKHSAAELKAAAEVSGLQVLKELAQSFAAKGAYKGWAEALNSGSKEVGRIALENFAAALESPVVARGLAKIAKGIIDAIMQHTKRHGQSVEARQCVERLLFAKVQAALGADVDASVVRETVEQTVEEQYGSWLGNPAADVAA